MTLVLKYCLRRPLTLNFSCFSWTCDFRGSRRTTCWFRKIWKKVSVWTDRACFPNTESRWLHSKQCLQQTSSDSWTSEIFAWTSQKNSWRGQRSRKLTSPSMVNLIVNPSKIRIYTKRFISIIVTSRRYQAKFTTFIKGHLGRSIFQCSHLR